MRAQTNVGNFFRRANVYNTVMRIADTCSFEPRIDIGSRHGPMHRVVATDQQSQGRSVVDFLADLAGRRHSPGLFSDSSRAVPCRAVPCRVGVCAPMADAPTWHRSEPNRRQVTLRVGSRAAGGCQICRSHVIMESCETFYSILALPCEFTSSSPWNILFTISWVCSCTLTLLSSLHCLFCLV